MLSSDSLGLHAVGLWKKGEGCEMVFRRRLADKSFVPLTDGLAYSWVEIETRREQHQQRI